MSSTTIAPDQRFTGFDEARPDRRQLKIMFVSGMGFFTDAYDLFVIGIAVSILKTQWDLSTTQVSLLSSTTLAASAVGAIVFGRIADIFGRKKMYGYEVLILAIGAVASAFAPSIGWLIAFRIVLGIGIGGDYPVSATIMAEYAGKRSRGKMVGLVFAMQAAGLVVGPLLAVILLAAGVSHDLTWRLLLGFGAIPGLAVFWLRRRISETPRFSVAASGELQPRDDLSLRHRQSIAQGFIELVTNPRLRRWLIGAAVSWCALDFAYYGNTIASPEIIKLLSPHASLIHSTLITLLIFVLAAVPGYFVAIATIERLGRRGIQGLGFVLMAAMYGLIGAVPGVTTTASVFVVLFGISYFFTEFGPNTTTFIYPAEIFPTDVRTSGHGIAAALGKMGAFAGTYLFPQMLSSWGIRGAEGVAAGVAVVGLAATVLLLPEPKGRTLEEIEASARLPSPVLVTVPA
jgi:MFS family permease